MKTDWQSWAALAVVFATAAVMAYRVLVRKKTGCGSNCGCAGGLQKERTLLNNKRAKTRR